MSEKRAQWLTSFLVVSGILNAALLVSTIYMAVRDKTIDLDGGFAVEQIEELIHQPIEEPAMTTEELFAQVQTSKDPALIEAFSLTPQYQHLLQVFGEELSQETLLELITSISWQQLVSIDAIAPTDLLWAYIRAGSPVAADLYLRDYREMNLAEEELAALVEAIEIPSIDAEYFLTHLLVEPHTDKLWQQVGKKLWAFSDEPIPDSYNHLATLKHFVPAELLFEEKFVDHVVQPGESLWGIATHYKTTVEALRVANEIESNQIRPGQTLKVPDHGRQDAMARISELASE